MNKEDLEKINTFFLIKNTGIIDEDPCFCGSGLLFSNCCKMEAKFWISETYLSKIISYGKAFNFNVLTIPRLFLNEFNKEFQVKFNICANPNCQKECIGSHIFGKSLLKKYFSGTTCQWFQIDDGGKKQLEKVGMNDDIKYPIFCADCDSTVFREIDKISHDILDKNNQFLHLLRVVSYQYQFTRAQLALSHQLVFSQIRISPERKSFRNDQSNKEEIDITQFHRNFIMYKYQKKLLYSLWAIYYSEEKTNFTPHVRVVGTKNVIFANGIICPQLDLQKNKIIIKKESSILYIVLPLSEKELLVVTYTQDEEYVQFLNQLYTANDYKFKKNINYFLAFLDTPHSLFLDSNYMVNSHILDKVNNVSKNKDILKKIKVKII